MRSERGTTAGAQMCTFEESGSRARGRRLQSTRNTRERFDASRREHFTGCACASRTSRSRHGRKPAAPCASRAWRSRRHSRTRIATLANLCDGHCARGELPRRAQRSGGGESLRDYSRARSDLRGSRGSSTCESPREMSASTISRHDSAAASACDATSLDGRRASQIASATSSLHGEQPSPGCAEGHARLSSDGRMPHRTA